MRKEIEERLSALAKRENLTILYACESGSRAWGFPSEDSDYDVRFVYVRERDWYLRVDHEFQRDVVEEPISDLLDISGWDLKKALKLLYKSNPALIEWFDSPIVYRSDDAFVEKFKALLPSFYSPRACFYHYANMARKNNREYLRGDTVRIKKYFYVLRPILAMLWIERGLGLVPMEYEVLVRELVDEPVLLADLDRLLEEKKKGFESKHMPKVESISAFIDRELERLVDKAQTLGKPEMNFEKLNAFFLEVVS